MSEIKDAVESLRRVRAIEKLIEGFDADQPESRLPVRVEGAHGRILYSRPWGYYVDLAGRIYETFEDQDEDDAPPTPETPPSES